MSKLKDPIDNNQPKSVHNSCQATENCLILF